MWTMKSKIGIMAILGLLVVLVVFASGCTDQKSNETNQDTSSNTADTSTVKAFNVKATMTGPSTAQKGSNVAINCSIVNKGSMPVKNVIAHSQDFDKNLGTIEAGQTKSFPWNVHIPTDKEVQADFGANATVSNPFHIGGFSVTCTDSNGAKHTITSNSLNIKLN